MKEQHIARAALSLYQARTGVFAPGERLIEDCLAEALRGHEDIDLPSNFCDRIEEIALSGDIEAELMRLDATLPPGQRLAQDCEWNGIKILEVAADALIDANFHREAAQVREVLATALGGRQP